MNNLDQFRLDQEMSAGYWVRKMGCNSLFGNLAIGARFHYSGSPETIYIKQSGGWYKSESNGRRYKTGAHTAVVAL